MSHSKLIPPDVGVMQGRLTVLRNDVRHVHASGRSFPGIEVRCKCGTVYTMRMSSFVTLGIDTCVLCALQANGTHHASKTPLHTHCLNMRARCYQRSRTGKDCWWDDRWSTFEGFVAHPPTVSDGHEWAPGLHLARVHDTGWYSPENARWRTKSENHQENPSIGGQFALGGGREPKKRASK